MSLPPDSVSPPRTSAMVKLSDNFQTSTVTTLSPEETAASKNWLVGLLTAFENKDLAWAEHFTDDVHWEFPALGSVSGKQSLREMASWMYKGFVQMDIEIGSVHFLQGQIIYSLKIVNYFAKGVPVTYNDWVVTLRKDVNASLSSGARLDGEFSSFVQGVTLNAGPQPRFS